MLYTYGATALIAAALAAGGAWKVQNWRFAAIERDRVAGEVQAARDQIKRADRAAEAYIVGSAKEDARERVVIKEVIRVIQDPRMLAECMPSDGLRILADDATAANARRGIAPAVPAASDPG